MKKRFFRAALTAATLALVAATPQVAAQRGCDPCCDPCWDPCACDGDFGIGAHALYWQPLHCRYNYGVLTTDLSVTTPVIAPGQILNSKDLSVKADYDWGFRVWGQYTQDCFFAKVGYTYFDSTTRDRTTDADGGILAPFGLQVPVLVPLVDQVLNTIFGTASEARVRFEYQNVDVRAGYNLCNSCCGDVYMFGNVRWVDIKRSREASIEGQVDVLTVLVDASSRVRDRSTFDGAGLGFGLGGRAPIFCDLQLFGELGVSGIIGSRKQPTSQLVGVEVVGIDLLTTQFGKASSSETCVVPELDAKIGLSYAYTCGCWTVVGEVGYEVDYFFNALYSSQPLLTAQLAGVDLATNATCEDVGFAGPFFGLRVLF